MLHRMDSVVLAVADAAATGALWERLLDAEPADGGEARAVSALGALSRRWRLGDGWVEVLEADGAGPVADAIAERGPHLFAGGFTTPDVAAFEAHLEARGVSPLRDGERFVLDAEASGIPGLRVIVGPDRPEPPVGMIDRFYELTDLVADSPAATDRAAEIFALDAGRFEPIASDTYGYEGTLTLFDRERLDRLEIITPNVEGTTMWRWYERFGGGLYMAFAESDRLAAIEERARELGVGHTAVPGPGERDERGAHTVFAHPKTLGGAMLGISRRGYAWQWSGHPERVR